MIDKELFGSVILVTRDGNPLSFSDLEGMFIESLVDCNVSLFGQTVGINITDENVTSLWKSFRLEGDYVKKSPSIPYLYDLAQRAEKIIQQKYSLSRS